MMAGNYCGKKSGPKSRFPVFLEILVKDSLKAKTRAICCCVKIEYLGYLLRKRDFL